MPLPNLCPCMKEETKESFKTTMKESFLILLYEMIGTMMLASMVSNYYFQKLPVELGAVEITDPADVTPVIPTTSSNKIIDDTGMLLGIFVTII